MKKEYLAPRTDWFIVAPSKCLLVSNVTTSSPTEMTVDDETYIDNTWNY